MRRLRRLLFGRLPWPDLSRLPAINAALAGHGLPPLNPDPHQPDPARLALAEGLTHRRLDRPGFADWLASRHPRRAIELRAAVEVGAGAAGRVYESRPDLRVALPFGLTPQQLPDLLGWMLSTGRHELGFSIEQAVWLAADTARRDDGLATLYRWNPDWQLAVPDAFTPTGWLQLVAHVQGLGLDPRAVGRMPPPDPPADLLMLSYFRNPCGLQVEADAIADELSHAGWRVGRRTLPGPPGPGCGQPDQFAHLETAPLTLAKLGAAESLTEAYHRAGLHPQPGVYRAASLSWELEQVPSGTAERVALANEVWTPSQFCSAAFEQALPGMPVYTLPPAIVPPRAGPFARAHFGLAPDRFLVLFCFDMVSVPGRKNPLAAARAFRQAFPLGSPAELCVKVSRGETKPGVLAELRASGAVVIDRLMARDEVGALMAHCDCYLSLHRSEGFGLTVAEAMSLGKPVVATDYSATAEFLDDTCGRPVRYRRVPVGPGNDPYPPDAEWAEPDESHAAMQLRWVFDNPEAARELGTRAALRITEMFSPAITTARIVDRLRAAIGHNSSGEVRPKK